jgi:hypothetical protein
MFCSGYTKIFLSETSIRYDNTILKHCKRKHHIELEKVNARIEKENKKHAKKRRRFSSKSEKEKEVARAVRAWWDKKTHQRTIHHMFKSSSKLTYFVRNGTILVAKKLGFDLSRKGIFRKSREEDESLGERICHDVYKRFEYLAECLEGSASYREIVRIVNVSANCAPTVSAFRGVTRERLTTTATHIGLICLQTISEILDNSYGFFIAIDGAGWKRHKHVGIRFRFYIGQDLHSVFGGHLCISSTPSTKTATAHVFDSIVELFDLIDVDWKDKLVGVTTDGARDMIGVYNGLQTRFKNVATHKLICIWCGCHQLDLELSHRYTDPVFAVGGVLWTTILDDFVTLLRKRARIFKGVCPSRANTRWYRVSRTTRWIATRYSEIREQHRIRPFSEFPSDTWWVVLFVVQEFSETCYKTIRRMQSKKMIVSQQKSLLLDLKATLRSWINAEKYVAKSVFVGTKFKQRFVVGTSIHEFEGDVIDKKNVDGKLLNVVKYADGNTGTLDDVDIQGIHDGTGDDLTTKSTISRALRTTRTFGSHVDLFCTLSERQKEISVRLTDWLCGETVAGLHARCASESTNGMMDSEPAYVLPVDIVRHQDAASRIIGGHARRFPADMLAKANDQFHNLISLQKNTQVWKMVLNASNVTSSNVMSSDDGSSEDNLTMVDFKGAWAADVLLPYKELREVCGTLATVFSHTAGVEGDFSIRKNVYQGRDLLNHFHAQCDIHCRTTFPLIKRLGLFPPQAQEDWPHGGL